MNNTLDGLKIGDVITYSYTQINKLGLPVLPKMERNQIEANWEELQQRYAYCMHTCACMFVCVYECVCVRTRICVYTRATNQKIFFSLASNIFENEIFISKV